MSRGGKRAYAADRFFDRFALGGIGSVGGEWMIGADDGPGMGGRWEVPPVATGGGIFQLRGPAGLGLGGLGPWPFLERGLAGDDLSRQPSVDHASNMLVGMGSLVLPLLDSGLCAKDEESTSCTLPKLLKMTP